MVEKFMRWLLRKSGAEQRLKELEDRTEALENSEQVKKAQSEAQDIAQVIDEWLNGEVRNG